MYRHGVILAAVDPLMWAAMIEVAVARAEIAAEKNPPGGGAPSG